MAIPLDAAIPIAIDDKFSQEFESLWFDLSLLTAIQLPQADMSLPIFSNGYMTPYFESIWSIATADLGKDNIDTGVILVDENGMPTPEFEAYWEDLTT